MQALNQEGIIQEVKITTARSGGPGGQHVNKTETKVILKWNPMTSQWLNDNQKELVIAHGKRKLDAEGNLGFNSSRYRSQLKNKQDVLYKLFEFLESALEEKKERKTTKTPFSVVQKRKKDKKVQSERKDNRRKIDPKHLMIGLLLSISWTFQAQLIKAPRLYSELIWSEKLDSLRDHLGENKEFLPDFELATLVALMHYPELKETAIVFKEKTLKSTMAARPKGLQVLRSKGKRTYVIYINTSESVKVPVDSVSFNAKVGVIGHELAHVLDYEQKSSLRVIGNGFGYVSKKFRAKFERATDQRTIDHGLGWQCYDWSHYVFHYKNIPPEYLEYKKKTYMGYEEIEQQLNQ